MKNVKQKVIVGGLFLLTLVLMIVGYIVLREPHLFNLCPVEAIKNCLSSDTTLGIAKPLYKGLQPLLPLFLILFCIRPDVFKLWWKFAIPFGLFLLYCTVAISPEGSSGWAYSGPDRTQAASFSALWLTISSLMLIAAKTWRPKWRAYYTIPVILLVSLIGLMFAGVRTFFF